MTGRRKVLMAGWLGGLLLASGQSVATVDASSDPWEGFNRGVYQFNDFLDRWFLKPVAQGYRTVTPQFVDDGVTNMFSNLSEVKNMVNSVLQGKPDSFSTGASRLMFNTTFGLAGWFDVASRWDLPQQEEDFGQTLAVWGVGSGPFLMLPFLGPSSPRDAVGLVGDAFTSPLNWMLEPPESYYVAALGIIDKRADLIPAESLIIGDRYAFLRNAYLQRREFLINDGKVASDPFADDDAALDDF